jgi:hypothetical protein
MRTVSTSAQAQNWLARALAGKPEGAAAMQSLRNILAKPFRRSTW